MKTKTSEQLEKEIKRVRANLSLQYDKEITPSHCLRQAKNKEELCFKGRGIQ